MDAKLNIGDKVYIEDCDVIYTRATIASIDNDNSVIGFYYDGDKAKVVHHTNISRVYKIVKGMEYKGEEICYEPNNDIDYPYFCPALYENCYECEVEMSRNDLKTDDTIKVSDSKGKTYEGVIVGFDNIYVKFITKEGKRLKAKKCNVKKIEKKAPKNLDIIGICVIFVV